MGYKKEIIQYSDYGKMFDFFLSMLAVLIVGIVIEILIFHAVVGYSNSSQILIMLASIPICLFLPLHWVLSLWTN